MDSVIFQSTFMANISFLHKFDNLAAILNILAYFSQTHPEMHVYLIFYVRANHKDSKKPYVINPLTAKLFDLNFHPLEVVSR